MIDIAIIGGGPAGYTAAERAVHQGRSVVLFEKKALGGTCLNEGCIPTKALLYSAKMYAHALEGTKYGVTAEHVTFDYAKMHLRKNKVVRKLTAGIKAKLTAENCRVVQGEAVVTYFSSEKIEIECNGECFEAAKLLLCMGSENKVPPISGINSACVWNSTDALNTNVLPTSIAIVGGGVIGMEFAALFHSLGVKVSVIEMLPEILGNMDMEISAMLRETYAKQGINFYMQAQVKEINDNEVFFEHEGEKKSIVADRILVNVGRRPITTGLDSLPLEKNRQGIAVNAFMQTNLPTVYAAGDITGISMLAHTAVREAEVAINNMCGIADEMHYNAIPGVVYTNPEVAGAGETETTLQQKGTAYKVKKIPMTYSGRFVAENEGVNGLCKILYRADDEKIVGVHILGNPASEIINMASLAIEKELTVTEWQRCIFGHPTVSEIIKETLFA